MGALFKICSLQAPPQLTAGQGSCAAVAPSVSRRSICLLNSEGSSGMMPDCCKWQGPPLSLRSFAGSSNIWRCNRALLTSQERRTPSEVR